VYFTCFELNGQDGGKGVVGSVSFDDDGSVGNPMSEDRSRGECIFEEIEGVAGFLVEVEGGTFVSKAGERDNDVGIVVNESTVEVSEAQEGLDVFHLLQLGPVADGLDLVCGHGETVGGKNVAQVLDTF